MVLRLNQNLTIENPQHYSKDDVEKLRALLVSGAEFLPDPHRKDFYEVANGARMFYIHVSPVSGTVFLLATWQKSAVPRKTPSAA